MTAGFRAFGASPHNPGDYNYGGTVLPALVSDLPEHESVVVTTRCGIRSGGTVAQLLCSVTTQIFLKYRTRQYLGGISILILSIQNVPESPAQILPRAVLRIGR
jgi:hypothetical protein